MKTASIRDLRYRFPTIERWLRAGETVAITRRGRRIARLAPESTADAVEMPDILGRLRQIYGNKILKPSTATLLRRERDERW